MATLGKELGARLREARASIGATQAEVAEDLGISAEVYGRMERGLTLPSLTTFVRILAVLRAKPEDLLQPAVSTATGAREQPDFSYGTRENPLSDGQRRLMHLVDRADDQTIQAMLSIMGILSKFRDNV